MSKDAFELELDDLFDGLEEILDNPEGIVQKQIIGETIECECPICNIETECKVLEIDKALCLNCNNVLPFQLTIEHML